jgi:hypothetical protein
VISDGQRMWLSRQLSVPGFAEFCRYSEEGPKRRNSDTGKDMGQITRSLKDESVSLLRKDEEAFVRVSVSLDPQFATPSFEDFARTS